MKNVDNIKLDIPLRQRTVSADFSFDNHLIFWAPNIRKEILRSVHFFYWTCHVLYYHLNKYEYEQMDLKKWCIGLFSYETMGMLGVI